MSFIIGSHKVEISHLESQSAKQTLPGPCRWGTDIVSFRLRLLCRRLGTWGGAWAEFSSANRACNPPEPPGDWGAAGSGPSSPWGRSHVHAGGPLCRGKASELESKDLSMYFVHAHACLSIFTTGAQQSTGPAVWGKQPTFRSSSLCCVSRPSSKKQRLTVVIPKNECGGFCGPSISVNSPQYSESSVPSNSRAPM